jgi:hypothetical protein
MRAQMVLIAMLVTSTGVASAQKTCDPAVDKDCRAPKVVPVKTQKLPKTPPTYTIDPMNVGGKVRGAMMLQFLERASEELERASLQQRSFVPELVRSVELEAL